MELVGPIFELLKCLGAPTCGYIDDHSKFEERINDLKIRVDFLNARKRDLELRIRAELQWGKSLKEEVKKWNEDAESIYSKHHDILQSVPNVSWFSRAGLGKRASQIAEEAQKIIDRGRFPEGVVIDNPSNKGVGFRLEHLEGEAEVMQEIWKFFMGDEIAMIGIYGMGGIGKTTVVRHTYNKLLKEAKVLFDRVIWVTVSKELNIAKLQKEIANALKIVALPESEQECVAALMDELGNGRYVLILDDVWKGFSLSDVGIPTSRNGSKLVLTTRSIDVCKFMGCEMIKVQPLSNEESMNLFLKHVGDRVLEVPPLKEILYGIVQECAGLPLAIVVIARSMKEIYDVHEWRNSLTELREHVRSVKGTDAEIYERLKFSYDRLGDSNIQNCFLYCSLYPEDYSISRIDLIEYWIDEGFLGSGRRQELYDRGHTILNRLENNCLLEKDGNRGNVKMHDVVRDTALYIKDRNCFMVKAGVGLEELPSEQEWTEDLEKVSLMRNSILEIPPYLSPECENLSTLLLRGNPLLQGIPESFFHHMHRLGILDLSYTNIEQLPISVSNLEKLNALVLRGCKKLRCVPSLEKLKSLRKLDLCNTATEKVPDGLELLANLTYLNLCTESLKELQISILSKLSCLQFLVFYVGPSALNLKGLEAARLRKLEIFEGRFHELIDFNAYSKSIQGKNLSYLLVMAPIAAMLDVRPDEAEDASLIREFKFMYNVACYVDGNSYEMLKAVVRHAGVREVTLDGRERQLTVGGDLALDPVKIKKILAKFGEHTIVSVQHVFRLPRHQPKKDVILHGDRIGSEDIVVLPSDLQCLRIFQCHNLRSLSYISFIQPTNELMVCSIHDCRGMEYMLDLSSPTCIPPQNLEFLWLQNLDKLHMLVKLGEASRSVVSTSSCSQPLPAGIFSHLKVLRVEGCSNLKQLFPFELALDCHNLETLVVGNCGQMEEIIASEEEEQNQKGKGTCSPMMKFKFSLPKLKLLELKKLRELKRICRSNGVMICDSLEKIVVLECPKLRRMALYLPLFQDSGLSHSHPFKRIDVSPKWWDSVEWEYPDAKNILKPFVRTELKYAPLEAVQTKFVKLKQSI